jgi:plastocyanin
LLFASAVSALLLAARAPADEPEVGRLLAASGVPNDWGRPRWPLGLRLLAETDELRRIDALLWLGAKQAEAGPAGPQITRELARAVEALRRRLLRDRQERYSLPATSYEECAGFLDRLDAARLVLEAGLAPADGARLETRPRAAGAVGVSDDRFDPPTLTVDAGTKVSWTNNGRHTHTVTSDADDWGSQQLRPGAVYSYTFTRPGKYTYHCEAHPMMKGTILVK